jgi:hypothetical protein
MSLDPAPSADPADQPYPLDVLNVPRGPGVQPPFVAPPTDGSRKRRWVGLGIGGAALVICLVGGVIGLGALVVSSEAARKDAATAVLNKYLTAWEHGDFEGAYNLVCERIRDETPLTQFSDGLRDEPLESYTLSPVEVAGADVYVPALLRFTSGGTRSERYSVVLDTTGDSFVCGAG